MSIDLSKHLLDRKQERKVPYEKIVEVLRHGRQQPGTIEYHHRNTVVVAERKQRILVVITVYQDNSHQAA